jgi:plastocyanin
MRRLSFTIALAIGLVGSLLLISPLEAGGGGHGGCARPNDGIGETVTIENNCFQTTVLYVQAGTTVTWTNRDYDSHNVTFFDGSQAGSTAYVYKDETVSHAFDQPGLFPYFCSIHPSMFGIVAAGDPADSAFGWSFAAQSPLSPTPPPIATPAPEPAETVTAAGQQASRTAVSHELTAALVLGVGLVSAGGGYWLRRLRN